MRIEKLSEANIPLYIDYLKASLAEEPDMMTIDRVDAPGILARTRDAAGCPPPLSWP